MEPVTILSRQIVGHSVEGRPIELACSDPAADQLDTLFIGVFHGNEGISGELLARFIALLSNQPMEKSVAIVPVLNPDGLVRQTRVNAHGVDLNRNFPAENWLLEGKGSPYYGGPSPGSEPETQVMIRLIEQYRPKKIVAVHSPYKVLNFDGPGRELADAMARHSGYEVVESIGYPTPGSFGTYAGIERSIPVITLELPPGVDDPPHDDQTLPPVTVEEAWEKNRDSLLAAIAFSG